MTTPAAQDYIRSSNTTTLGEILNYDQPFPYELGYTRQDVKDELHRRALDEYLPWIVAKDYIWLRTWAREYYDTAALSAFLGSPCAGYPRRVFLDELHTRAIACFNEENQLVGTVMGVPGVQYGTRRRRLRLS